MPGDKTKKKKKGKKKHKEDKVKNSRGEVVSVKEFALEQTLEATNRSLGLYRERMEKFIETNETLQETCTQQEQDALEVIAALQQENEKKETEIKLKEKQLEDEREKFKQEREGLVSHYDRKMADMNLILNEKETAFKVMQNEFTVIKDFRKKRHELLKELENQKLELEDTERRHKEIVQRMERKFFEEKIRLQKDANRKIAELATKAHKEAVTNLKETTKEVYKENLQMAEALRYHVQEGEELVKQNVSLSQNNRHLSEEKELHNVIVKEKIMQSKQQAQEMKDLQTKIQSMEHSLTHVVREFEHERDIIGRMAKKELEDVRKIAMKLRNNLTKKTAEMKHIKRLAQHILDQRTELEKYFMESLDFVRKNALKERDETRKLQAQEYNKKVREVIIGKSSEFPAVQPFRKNPLAIKEETILGQNAPSVFTNAKGEMLDVMELTWADKERVLRLLFSKMNGMSNLSSQEDDDDQSEYSESSQIGAAREVYIGSDDGLNN